MIQAILFAANGVLVETYDIHGRALNEALASHNLQIAPEEEATYRGLSTMKKLALLTETKGLDPSSYVSILARKQAITIDLIDHQVAIDLEKIDLCAAAKDAGMMLAVCSNSRQSTLMASLEAVGVAPYIDLAVGNDLGLPPKPDPAVYLHAAQMLGVPISRCAIVERGPIGIKAAKGTGCPTIVRVKATDEVSLSLLHFLIPNQPMVRFAGY